MIKIQYSVGNLTRFASQFCIGYYLQCVLSSCFRHTWACILCLPRIYGCCGCASGAVAELSEYRHWGGGGTYFLTKHHWYRWRDAHIAAAYVLLLYQTKPVGRWAFGLLTLRRRFSAHCPVNAAAFLPCSSSVPLTYPTSEPAAMCCPRSVDSLLGACDWVGHLAGYARRRARSSGSCAWSANSRACGEPEISQTGRGLKQRITVYWQW